MLLSGMNAPIIVADGLLGDDSIDIDIGGEVFDSITVASAIAKADCTRMENVMAGYAACCGRRQVLMQIS